jgi:hypothetical protein
MNFLVFNGLLLISAFISIIVFSIGLFAFLVPTALFFKKKPPSKIFSFPIFVLSAIYQIYFWGLWATFCVTITNIYVSAPDVTLNWLYWICSFLWCISVIGWLFSKEKQKNISAEEMIKLQRGTIFYSFIATIAFLVFAFSPTLMLPSYGWALKLLASQDNYYSKPIAENEKMHRSVEAFFHGYNYVINANKLAQNIAESKDPQGDWDKIITMLNSSIDTFNECDAAILNEIFNGWGDILINKLVPAIDFQLSGIQENGDRNNLERSNALLAEFDDWLKINWNKLLLVLNQKHGFAINK